MAIHAAAVDKQAAGVVKTKQTPFILEKLQNTKTMSSTKWGIVSTGLISGDFVSSIFTLNNSTDHQVKITTFLKQTNIMKLFFKK